MEKQKSDELVAAEQKEQLNMQVLAAHCFDTLIAKLSKQELPKYLDSIQMEPKRTTRRGLPPLRLAINRDMPW